MSARPANAAALAHALLQPASVALVGASDDRGKTAGRPLDYLRRAGYAGRLYPVNPTRSVVQGEPSWPTLAALPEVPEQVFALVPTAGVLDVARECARLGVPVLTVLAGGFAEEGPEGLAREEALRQIAQDGGLRILGPSSLGVVSPTHHLVLTANAAFAEPELPGGRVFVASQSGSMIGALVSRGKARGIGYAGLVSVGGEVDLSVGEICAATLDDPGIEGYLLFLESLRHGDALRAFALEAVARGKPVIAYKLGRSAAAAEMAATHTGALAGEDDVADAFFRDLGIARVGVLEALLETHPLARRVPLAPAGSPPGRVGVVTTTGGGAAMAVDQLGIRDVVVQPPSPDTLRRLAEAGLPATPGRVLDLTLAGARYEVMKGALDILLSAPEFDLIVAVVGSSARYQPQLAVQPIIDSASSARPLAAMLVPDAPEALARLTAADMPCFRTPEACGDGIAAVLRRRAPTVGARVERRPVSSARTSSEPQAYAVLDRVGVPHAPYVVAPLAGPVPHLPFDFPVVVKVCTADIPHKTEVGGVVLHVRDAAELDKALVTLRSNLAEHAPGVPCEEVLIQPMCRGLAEALIGYRVDPEAGPMVMLAAGGIWAEIAHDRSLRLAPVTIETAREMIAEVRALKSLTGLRGRVRGDLDALACAIARLSRLGDGAHPDVVEAEVNPLLVLPEGEGVLAVDALVLSA